MAEPTISLLVLRTHDLERAVRFYQLIGVTLLREQHGDGPVHYSATLGPTVLELYPAPAAAGPHPAHDPKAAGVTMIGVRVQDLASVLDALHAAGAVVRAELRTTHWGLRAVVADPDGRTIELTQ